MGLESFGKTCGRSVLGTQALCALALCGIVILSACDQDTAGPTVQNPATQPVTEARANPPQTDENPAPTLATLPASRPAVSFIYVDRVRVIFPPAMLRLNVKDGKVLAELFSDDPSAVLEGKESVNSYDFEMTLPDIHSAAELDKAIWTSQSQSSSRVDTPYGIILPEAREILQPKDVAVSFTRKGDRVLVMIQGEFWMFSTDNHIQTPGVIVNVMASLDAGVVGG